MGPFKDGDQVISNNTGMADLLNQFFFTVEDPVLRQPSRLDLTDKLVNVEFAANANVEKIQSLKSASAPGPDRICSQVLKETANILCIQLSIVLTHSMEEGLITEDWHKAINTPIFKSGS